MSLAAKIIASWGDEYAIAVNSSYSAGSGARALSFHAGAQAGDLVLIYLNEGSDAASSLPTWTAIGNGRFKVLSDADIAASQTGSVVLNLAVGNGFNYYMLATYRGPTSVLHRATESTTTNPLTPSTLSLSANSAKVLMVFGSENEFYSPPAATTRIPRFTYGPTFSNAAGLYECDPNQYAPSLFAVGDPAPLATASFFELLS